MVRSRLVTRIVLAAAVVTVFVIVFTPGPPAAGAQRRLAAWLVTVHRTWMPGWITFGLIEFLSNAVMFLPLGLLGALVWHWSRRYFVVVACCGVSIGIELFQTWVMPGRLGSVTDVVANTVGAAVGYGLAELWLARRRHTVHQDRARGERQGGRGPARRRRW